MSYKGCYIRQYSGAWAIFGFDHIVEKGFGSMQQAKDFLDNAPGLSG